MVDLAKHWQSVTWLSLLLWPLGLVFCTLAWGRRWCYRLGLLRQYELAVPVIIIGNITVGGTGKTPLVIWMAEYLQRNGYTPGVIVRGYRGTSRQWPQLVAKDSDAEQLGDEAVLLAWRCTCPVAAGPDRGAAARLLIENKGCNIIISDDGLQHYALPRTIEIAVIDGIRRQGNGFCLPAGPLREPVRRLHEVDICITNGLPQKNEYSMTVKPGRIYRLTEPEAGKNFIYKRAHAVAGIGNPIRFFSQLETLGIDPIKHVFPDHHQFNKGDLVFDDKEPVIMTEKDAVKCRSWAEDQFWVLPIAVEPDETFAARVLALLQERKVGQEAA
ncbi:MAG: tetraacyldisaccharide 4'-kinase [Gammaproteobacteria bacterium]|nr:MAG: tetraacyldisaccharide 4'-kinase [Gammaproteobacteria bacterium]